MKFYPQQRDYVADAVPYPKTPPPKQRERDQFTILTGNVRDLSPEERIKAATLAAAEPDAEQMLDMLGLTKEQLRKDVAAVFHPQEKSA